MIDSPALALLYQAALAEDVRNIGICNAHFHPLLADLKKTCADIHFIQHFKPEINALASIGGTLDTFQGKYDLMLLLPSKDKQQSLAWIAQAFAHLQDGGKLLLACENKYGAKSYESALKKVAGHVNTSSKAKCRLCSAQKTTDIDEELQQLWSKAAMPERMQSHGLWAQAGLFSWKNADLGSQLLIEALPDTLAGVGMDLCCGYGFLSANILKKNEDISHLYMVEADALALTCAKKNTEHATQVSYHHLDATTEPLPKKTDWLVCNPPFHHGHRRDVALGQSIVMRACHALKSGGDLYMVANRQLPYELILQQHLTSVKTLITRDGFKVLHGKR